MFDHVAINVSSMKKSQAFYEKALKPLGYGVVMTFGTWVGFGQGKKPQFWIVTRKPVTKGAHLALAAADRKSVKAFHKAALAAGGNDNGKPGVRKDYSPTYYAAFVHDPDGNNIEVVTHGK
jgi:catechol 2,3-dioxygenase-like lactoylglutathione lyase family enzyme